MDTAEVVADTGDSAVVFTAVVSMADTDIIGTAAGVGTAIRTCTGGLTTEAITTHTIITTTPRPYTILLHKPSTVRRRQGR